MRIFLVFLGCLGICAAVSAQQPSALLFDEYTFDFGSVREDGGVVTHAFAFRNGGRQPVAVLEAATACGCTVPSFSRRPVRPSESGVIEVSYDPMDRPGYFEKKITVTTSEKSEPVRLYITGNVLPREKSLEELYPVYVGSGLRAETNFHSFAYAEHGKSARTGTGLVNTSAKPLKIRVSEDSLHKVFRLAGETSFVLAPGGRRELEIVAEAAEGVYGTVTEHFVFEVDGRRSDATLAVTGIAIDNRDDRADNFVPKAELSKNIVIFGALKHAGPEHTEYFDMVNTGSAPLHIRAVEGCSESMDLSLRAGESLAAGERRRVGVTVDPTKKSYGPSVRYVRIITDDPLRPVREIKVTATITD